MDFITRRAWPWIWSNIASPIGDHRSDAIAAINVAAMALHEKAREQRQRQRMAAEILRRCE